MRVLVLTALIVASAAQNNFFRLPQPHSYSCVQNKCVRFERSEVSEHHSFDYCQLTCGESGSILPKPTGETQLSKDVFHFDPYNLRVTKVATSNPKVAEMLNEATRYFFRNLHFIHPDFPESYKTPYTDDMKEFFDETETNPRERFSQRVNQFRIRPKFDEFSSNRKNLLNEFNRFRNEATQNEFSSSKPRTYEEWERYSPFRNERYNPTIDRHNVNLEFTITSPEEKFSFENTDESYNMVVQTLDDETTITILAASYYGARHALETLSQLVTYDNENGALMMIKNAKVQDQPQYRYRGLMLDTGRNFYTKNELLSLLDSMSQNKMNAFHWHITDAASFPLYSNRQPQMAYYGAYSPRKVYLSEDISEIVQYGKLRGVMVVPELDAPAHTNAGWAWGEKEGKGTLVLCTNKERQTDLPWFELSKEPPSGQLNPVNPEVYSVLGEVYRDMMDYFDPEMFHMGGDDVSFKCWQNSDEVITYLAENKREPSSREYFELWNKFQNNAFSKLREAAGDRKVTPIIHSSSFARNYIDKDTYVIMLNEEANNSVAFDYVSNGFKVIFTNPDQWRLDCDANSWVGDKAEACPQIAPTWRNFYENSPLEMLFNLGMTDARFDLPENRPTFKAPGQTKESTLRPRDYVLGATASLWSYATDGQSLHSRIWPRLSAFAERLWTDPLHHSLYEIDPPERRINIHRERMVQRGIRADPLQPGICLYDQSTCYDRQQYELRSALPTQ
ncbi:chitooligosaccharidolytic beta-N-acetylglucosaminidase-like [Macrobrachium nipponense]|uniref:chitooligosaccharidolytic beta-N-acetylglucosaminidase-like n=1 Tax=Macrobrachium nipponense TaxID=159736 RepID=UPI0030C7BFB5